MLTYIIRRLLYSIVVLFVASVIVFWGINTVTSPIGYLQMQPNFSQQTIDNIIERKNLDDPMYKRYGYWVQDMFTDKFGTETVSDLPIWPQLKRALSHTVQLIVAAELIAILLAVGIGVYSALRQYSAFDYAATTFSFVGLAMPVFWLALMLQILFVNIYLWFDVRIFYVASLNSVDPGSGFHFVLDRAQHLALPVIVLAVASIAICTTTISDSSASSSSGTRTFHESYSCKTPLPNAQTHAAAIATTHKSGAERTAAPPAAADPISSAAASAR